MGDPFEGLFESGEVLERVGVNLTTQARRGDLEPVRCRDAEIARVVDILLRQSKNNPALIGKAGVGKTRSEEHTSELQSRLHLVCRLLLEKKKKKKSQIRIQNRSKSKLKKLENDVLR